MISERYMTGQCHAFAKALCEQNEGFRLAAIGIEDTDGVLIDLPHVVAYDGEYCHDIQGRNDTDSLMSSYDDDMGNEGVLLFIGYTWNMLLLELNHWGYQEADLSQARSDMGYCN